MKNVKIIAALAFFLVSASAHAGVSCTIQGKDGTVSPKGDLAINVDVDGYRIGAQNLSDNWGSELGVQVMNLKTHVTQSILTEKHVNFDFQTSPGSITIDCSLN